MKFAREKRTGKPGILTVSGKVRELLALIRTTKCTQPEVANAYMSLFSLVRGDDPCWTEINAAIVAKWPRGLNRVKVMAWKLWEASHLAGVNASEQPTREEAVAAWNSATRPNDAVIEAAQKVADAWRERQIQSETSNQLRAAINALAVLLPPKDTGTAAIDAAREK